MLRRYTTWHVIIYFYRFSQPVIKRRRVTNESPPTIQSSAFHSDKLGEGSEILLKNNRYFPRPNSSTLQVLDNNVYAPFPSYRSV